MAFILLIELLEGEVAPYQALLLFIAVGPPQGE
jgi:hypothetical protein